MKKTIKPIYLFLAIFGVFVLLAILYYFQVSATQAPTDLSNSESPAASQPTPFTKTIKFESSSVLDLSIQVPLNCSVEERFTSLTIDCIEGKINMSRSGTDHPTLSEYLDALDNLNRNEIKEQDDEYTISEYTAISRVIQSPFSDSGELKEVIIFVDGRVFNFSTDDLGLYDDLDRIAKSFKYIPD